MVVFTKAAEVKRALVLKRRSFKRCFSEMSKRNSPERVKRRLK